MSLDFSRFHKLNVTDTCAVWNILSSRILYARAKEASVEFCCTRFVIYESLLKPRKRPKASDHELQERLQKARANGDFGDHDLSIDDLQDIGLLKNRKRLGKGELSSIAFAQKTRQAFMTDDQKARKLADEVMTEHGCQTTPHLFGWLFFSMQLTDADKHQVIGDLKDMGSCLCPHMEDAYNLALQFRLTMWQNNNIVGDERNDEDPRSS